MEWCSLARGCFSVFLASCISRWGLKAISGPEGSQQLQDWKLMSGMVTQPAYPGSPKHVSSCPLSLQAFCRREGMGASHCAGVHSPNSQTSHVQKGTGEIFYLCLEQDCWSFRHSNARPPSSWSWYLWPTRAANSGRHDYTDYKWFLHV